MIIGVGTDIVNIDRIQKACENPRFLDEYFSKAEREFFKEKKNPVPTIANNFAAKEAFSKALGTGVRGFRICEIEILRDNLGKPYIQLLGSVKNIADKMGVKNIHISMSNTDLDAIAFVILEG